MAQRAPSRKVSIIGAGNVGTALAALCRRKGLSVVSVISRNREDARRAAALGGCQRFFSRDIADLHPTTNVLLIAVSDAQVRSVAREVAHNTQLDFSHLYAAHTSGILTSNELSALERQGAVVFSFHPMQSFPTRDPSAAQVKTLEGITYGVEGSPKAVRFARQLARQLGGISLRVPKEQKILYHLACVVASNYSVALLGAIEDIASGFVSGHSLQHFRKLIESSIEHSLRLTPQKALTGPIVRGDRQALQAHLAQLTGKRRHLRQLYKILGLYALSLAEREKHFSRLQLKQLKTILRAS
ncbi:MAG TPA: Rossmann-like and DUF2520 domain-containing protein [Bacteroidota bacterium]